MTKQIFRDGKIVKGNVCPYSSGCPFKEKANNGHGCVIVDNPVDYDVSCGMARAMKLVDNQ